MNLFLNNLNINMDAPSAWGIYFQDSATPQMEGLVELHDMLKSYVILIIIIIIISSSLSSLIRKNQLIRIRVKFYTFIGHILARWSMIQAGVPIPVRKGSLFNSVGFITSLQTIRGSYSSLLTSSLFNPKRGYSSMSRAAGSELKNLTNSSGDHSEIPSGILSGDNNSSNGLKPGFITGFTDAEGSFMCIFRKKLQGYNNVGWNIEVIFQIKLHKKDEELLNLIQNYFGVGNVVKSGDNASAYIVRSLDDITQKIIPHFDNYSLKTQKLADYLLWKEIVMSMGSGDHLTVKGVQKIVNLRASLNLGISDALKLKLNLFTVTPVSRPNVVSQSLKNTSAVDCEWVAGFTSGEGSFKVKIKESPRTKVGFKTFLEFGITQHSRDEQLMVSLIDFFGCGQYKLRGGGNLPAGDFYCVKFSDIQAKIIPFFQKHSIIGIKSLDFADWCKVAELMQNNAHKNSEGLDVIRQLKSGINRGRNWK